MSDFYNIACPLTSSINAIEYKEYSTHISWNGITASWSLHYLFISYILYEEDKIRMKYFRIIPNFLNNLHLQ
jgi:hypothetical protein